MYAVSLSKERYRIDEERYLIGSGSRLQLLQSRVFLNADSSRLSRQYEVLRASQIILMNLWELKILKLLMEAKDTVIIVNAGLNYEDLLDRYPDSKYQTCFLLPAIRLISEYDRQIIASRTYPYVNLIQVTDTHSIHIQPEILNNQQTLGLNYGLQLA
jgi:outer membrane protein, adhesin transport system